MSDSDCSDPVGSQIYGCFCGDDVNSRERVGCQYSLAIIRGDGFLTCTKIDSISISIVSFIQCAISFSYKQHLIAKLIVRYLFIIVYEIPKP